MDQKRLQDTAKAHVPKTHKGKNALVAFISGGVIGAIGQGLCYVYMQSFEIDKETALPMVIVTIILITAITTGFGIYDKAAQYCGAGLFIPISGFANSLTSAAMEGKS